MLILGSFAGQAQEFFLKQSGYEDVVREHPGRSAQDLYSLSKEYIHRSYKNPDYVSKGDIPGKYISFVGFAPNQACYTSLGMTTCLDISYRIVLDFKDGKYKMSVQELYVQNEIRHGDYNYPDFWKRNGEVAKHWLPVLDATDLFFNTMLSDIDNYIKAAGNVNDDW
jgi:hypothetical protein